MKKSELIDGDVVVLRDGCMHIVIGDQLSSINRGYMNLDSYNDDLKVDSGYYDIMKVYRTHAGLNYLFNYEKMENGNYSHCKLIWERKEIPTIDWSKVKQNEPIKIVDKGDFYMVRHFHSIENGIVRVVPDGKTTFTSDDGDYVVAKEIVLDFSHFELMKNN